MHVFSYAKTIPSVSMTINMKLNKMQLDPISNNKMTRAAKGINLTLTTEVIRLLRLTALNENRHYADSLTRLSDRIDGNRHFAEIRGFAQIRADS